MLLAKQRQVVNLPLFFVPSFAEFRLRSSEFEFPSIHESIDIALNSWEDLGPKDRYMIAQGAMQWSPGTVDEPVEDAEVRRNGTWIDQQRIPNLDSHPQCGSRSIISCLGAFVAESLSPA